LNILTIKMRPLIVLPLVGVLLTISLLLFASFILQRPSFQKLVIERISDATGFDINTSEIDLNLWRGIGISVYGLEARSREGFEKVIASRVKISLDAGQLVRGRIVPARIYLYKPKIELDIPGEFGVSGEGAAPITLNPRLFWIPGIKSIIVDKGYLGIKNMPFFLHDLNLDAHPQSPARQPGSLAKPLRTAPRRRVGCRRARALTPATSAPRTSAPGPQGPGNQAGTHGRNAIR